jgi:uncharacterized OsmC-like protein
MSDVAETIIVDETWKRDFQGEVKVGTSTLLMDEPVQSGRLGIGSHPYDLLSAAIGACALTTIRPEAVPGPFDHRVGLHCRDQAR